MIADIKYSICLVFCRPEQELMQKPVLPVQPSYWQDLNTRLRNNHKIRLMIMGLASVGNSYYGSSGNPMAILQLTEEQKQQIFKTNVKKTIAILFSEFVEGHGQETREFDESMPVTQQIKNSPATRFFYDYFYPLYKSNKFKEGVMYQKLMLNSPDNAPSYDVWIKQLLTYFTNETTFWTGSLTFFFKIESNTLKIRAYNDYTIASGVTRNNNDNLKRIPGYRCPLGNTYQYFNFSITLNDLKKIYE